MAAKTGGINFSYMYIEFLYHIDTKFTQNCSILFRLSNKGNFVFSPKSQNIRLIKVVIVTFQLNTTNINWAKDFHIIGSHS